MATDVTVLLHRWKSGDKEALDGITALLYPELRRLASGFLSRERKGHTLQATALVNEAYMKLAGLGKLDWKDRAHFVGIAAHIMRQVLVQHARTKNALKRGGDLRPVTLDEFSGGVSNDSAVLAALDDALTALAAIDERKSQIVEMKYFGGMNAEETAEACGVSVSTVGRQLRLAEAWVYRHMQGESPAEEK
ncbi:MAG: sigma-70 family RNA polymerase sigma factor [Acidobacteria bacterium]|nr:sigma-70 family RNA polymerase sigma factor [Acidobacteriota bacterium]